MDLDGAVAPHAPKGVYGSIPVPPSKSLTQRAVVAAAMAGAPSRVERPLDAEDPRLLFGGLQAAGYRLTWDEGGVAAGGRAPVASATLFMGNNGTGLRFLLAQLAATPGRWVLDGVPRLRQRPVAALVAALRQLGAEVRTPPDGASLPLAVEGRELVGDQVVLDPGASSQFVSALLLLGARLPGGLTVALTGTPPSRPYLALTAQVLAAFGVRATAGDEGRTWRVEGKLRPATVTVEGDWSAAAFPLCAAAVAGGRVEVTGVRRDSPQGDAVVLALLEQAGCAATDTGAGVVVEGPARRCLEADLRDTPDLFPALAVVVACAGGRLEGLGGLAAKESHRLAVMGSHLRSLGFDVQWDEASFSARPGAGGPAPQGPLNPHGDHRIAMALAVAGCVVPGVRVSNPGCVAKSWPDFWPRWRRLVGGR